MTYEVQLEALKTDADMWDETSSTLLNASTNAWGLNLGEYELSWAAEVVGLTDTYSAIQAKVAGLLSEGSTETSNISGTLRAIKRNYEQNEDNAEQHYKGAWEPVG
jgi:hypothetical protein